MLGGYKETEEISKIRKELCEIANKLTEISKQYDIKIELEELETYNVKGEVRRIYKLNGIIPEKYL